MRVEKQLGFVAGAILTAALGLSSIAQGAPLSNSAAATVEATRGHADVEGRMEKAHYTGHPHTHHHTHHHHHGAY